MASREGVTFGGPLHATLASEGAPVTTSPRRRSSGKRS
jgi:hypothetical protein